MMGRPDWVQFTVGLAAIWGGAVLWLLMPFDLLPDFLPFVGWLDDLTVLLSASGLTAFWAHRALQRPALAAPGPMVGLSASSTYDPVNTDELKDW
jgi:hypothetical protein